VEYIVRWTPKKQSPNRSVFPRVCGQRRSSCSRKRHHTLGELPIGRLGGDSKELAPWRWSPIGNQQIRGTIHYKHKDLQQYDCLRWRTTSTGE